MSGRFPIVSYSCPFCGAGTTACKHWPKSLLGLEPENSTATRIADTCIEHLTDRVGIIDDWEMFTPEVRAGIREQLIQQVTRILEEANAG